MRSRRVKKHHHLMPRTSARAITLAEYLEQEMWDARIREAKAIENGDSPDAWTQWHRQRKSEMINDA